jgi:hypothetical protein
MGSGSSDLANWSRETLVLRPVKNDLYELLATKRWRRLGWTDADGKPTQSRLIAHGRNGRQYWRLVNETDLDELGARPYTDAAALGLVPDAGIDKTRLVELVEQNFTVQNRTARKYVSDLAKPYLRTIGGKRQKCALLSESERVRKDVYPDKPKGPGVIWLMRAIDSKQPATNANE